MTDIDALDVPRHAAEPVGIEHRVAFLRTAVTVRRAAVERTRLLQLVLVVAAVFDLRRNVFAFTLVITSYSIHYTKLYEKHERFFQGGRRPP